MPELVPLLVGHLVERALDGEPDVVHEAVDRPSFSSTSSHDALRLARAAEIGGNVQGLADSRRLAPAAARDDRRAFGGEQPGDLEADAAGRAGDETDAVAESEIHGSLA